MDGRPDGSKVVTSTTITLLPPPPPQPALPATTDRENTGNRMARVLTILQAEPERLWRSREIAELLGDVTLVATYRQLARRTERGMIKRVRTGRYTAITQIPNPLRDQRKR
jgi:predicted transcriptional regulator of viral defense system